MVELFTRCSSSPGLSHHYACCSGDIFQDFQEILKILKEIFLRYWYEVFSNNCFFHLQDINPRGSPHSYGQEHRVISSDPIHSTDRLYFTPHRLDLTQQRPLDDRELYYTNTTTPVHQEYLQYQLSPSIHGLPTPPIEHDINEPLNLVSSDKKVYLKKECIYKNSYSSTKEKCC